VEVFYKTLAFLCSLYFEKLAAEIQLLNLLPKEYHRLHPEPQILATRFYFQNVSQFSVAIVKKKLKRKGAGWKSTLV